MTLRIKPEQDAEHLKKSELLPGEAVILSLLLGHKFSKLEEMQATLAGMAIVEDISKHEGTNRFLQVNWTTGAVSHLCAEDTTKL